VDTPDPRSHIAPIAKRDAGTLIGGFEDLPQVEPPEMRRICRRLVELATREAPRPDLDAGYRLAWGRRDEYGWLDLSAEPGAFAVIGRHSRADVVLPHDEEVSLRHLLATAYLLARADGGRPDVALRLLDLRATLPILLEDGTERRSIVATGPLCVRLGSYVLAAFPVHQGNLEVAGDAHLDPSGMAQPAIRSEPLPPKETSRAWRTSEIFVLPRSSQISQIMERAGAQEPKGARVTLEREGRAATASLAESELANGVLVGRAEKCADHGMRALLTERISRVHLLLLAEGERVIAYDLCTTNGTRRDGERFRSTILDDQGTRLLLGSRRDGVFLVWRRAKRGASVDSYL
jgi:hypothetical protein